MNTTAAWGGYAAHVETTILKELYHILTEALSVSNGARITFSDTCELESAVALRMTRLAMRMAGFRPCAEKFGDWILERDGRPCVRLEIESLAAEWASAVDDLGAGYFRSGLLA
ncbi:MAG: hypothetical protein JXQ91_13290 [Vannielia sp.]|uniref:hypothetical protein n=1 Tax=Vannielia sp. TaxID=2813045 RepID=UPI003B8D2955